MKKIAIYIVVMTIVNMGMLTAKASTTDSLLSNRISKEKPYLVLNFTSNDCMLCRSGASGILGILGEEQKNKVCLLSDDRGMQFYFNKNSSLYGNINVVYDKELSRTLAVGPSSTACLVEEDTIRTYILSEVTDAEKQYLKSVLGSSPKVGAVQNNKKVYNTKDSLLSFYHDFSQNLDAAFVFNAKFQAGFLYNKSTETGEYVEPSITVAKIDSFHSFLGAYYGKSHKLTDGDYSKKILRQVGIPDVMFKSANLSGTPGILFRLNSVYDKGTEIEGDDTTINVGIRGRYFIAKGNLTENKLNIDNYKDITWVDTFHHNKRVYRPESGYKYNMSGDTIRMVFAEANEFASRISPFNYVMVEMRFVKDGKTELMDLKQLYTYPDSQKLAVPMFIDYMGNTFVTNDSTKVLYSPELDRNISYSEIDANDEVDHIYAALLQNNKLTTVYAQQDNIVLSSYDVLNKKATKKVISKKATLSDAQIISGNVLLYNKNTETNGLVFEAIALN